LDRPASDLPTIEELLVKNVGNLQLGNFGNYLTDFPYVAGRKVFAMREARLAILPDSG
jgi:hypothetical protein